MSADILVLAFIAFILWYVLRRRAAVLPGEIVYQDTPDAPTLVSHRYRVSGRPDYVTRKRAGLVPVEVKSRACGKWGPRDGERAQLLVYCLLAEDDLGGPVAYGVLQYSDRSVRVPFGDRQRREIVAVLAQMEAATKAHRSHRQAARCKGCGFRGKCDEALV